MTRLSTSIQGIIILWVLLLCAVSYQLISHNKKEGFISSGVLSLTPGKYPISVVQPLLYDTYKVKKNPGLSDNESADIYKNNPVFPAGCTHNNNIRYWKKPTNGKCSTAEFCGNLYKTTILPITPPPKSPGWDSGIRVNYYDSSAFCE